MYKYFGYITIFTLMSICMAGAQIPPAPAASAPAAPEAAITNLTDEPTTTKDKDIMVTIKTTKGDITLKLFEKEAPETVKNFLQYAKDGHYNDTIFHRVIDNFMIQGGGFTQDMNQKATRAPVKNEADNRLENKRGTIAMARTQVIDSATSQFFINVADNAFLNYRDPSVQGFGYCVFGEVIDGMDVVDAIKGVQTGSHGPFQDVPSEPIVITEVTVSE